MWRAVGIDTRCGTTGAGDRSTKLSGPPISRPGNVMGRGMSIPADAVWADGKTAGSARRNHVRPLRNESHQCAPRRKC